MSGGVLAFDFGEQRIGIATGDTLVGIAHPLETLHGAETEPRFQRITKLNRRMATQRPCGWPTHTCRWHTTRDDSFGCTLCAAARRFGLTVFLVDERHSSLVAEALLKEVGVRGRKQKPALDQVAAQAIFANFLRRPEMAIAVNDYICQPQPRSNNARARKRCAAWSTMG